MAETNSFGGRGIIFISVLAVCVVIIIGLQAATLHRLVSQCNGNDGTQPTSQSKQSGGQNGLECFSGLFETEYEILARARVWRRNSSLMIDDPDDVNLDCSGDNCFVSLATFHTCCCAVNSTFTAPNTARDLRGVVRSLAQFDGKKQYFYTEKCTQTESPSSCRCTTTPLLSSAVYNVTGAVDEYGISYFNLGSLCRSLNV